MASSKKTKQQKVLDELQRHGNISRAARCSGVNRRTINRWRETDPVFSAAAKAALIEGRA